MPWYDTKLNPIDNPPNDKTCIFVQKPHTRTVPFYDNNHHKKIYKQIELPWTVFVWLQKMNSAFFAATKEMPTLNLQLYKMKTLGICGFVCLEYFNCYYDKNNATPQDRLEYFWSSAFEAFEESAIKTELIELIPMENIDINYLLISENKYHF